MSANLNPKKRGSQLLRELHGDHHGLDRRSLELIDSVMENEAIQLLGWHRRGVPPVEQVLGQFLVPGPDVPAVVNQFRQGLPWGVHVFPYGIPPVYLTVLEVTQDVAPAAASTNVATTAGL